MGRPLAYQVRLQTSFDDAVELVIDALKKEGFGVITQIDVTRTLKEKLGEEFRPYKILGACNPPLAHRALVADPAVGVLLPCNVTVEELDGESVVSLANPEGMLTPGTLEDNLTMQEVVREANNRIKQVATHLGEL